MEYLKKQPLISCLCVTHNKPHMLKRVIDCFNNQSYVNKQLVIVYEEDDAITHEFIINQIFRDNIKAIKIETSIVKLSLGELRNISVEQADGEYVCQWDDDDWFSPDRLEIQMEYIQSSRKCASILSRWLVFNSRTNKAYLSNYRLWEGSLLCRKDLMVDNPYHPISKGEDSSVVEALYSGEKLYIIDDQPELYIYVFHGNNTWEQEHFEQIFFHSIELDSVYTSDIIEILEMDCE